ncbi:complex I NDUFA9 subunit family protein [Desulfallas sp. Bu1-1]|uniref:SDR family oxidoreductase n=1 Tax=Desulfallas sp. Bu1-1 TaxID=2787620 RepID=UPI00189F739A|nr:complex I NDUFA9 subunit family protein [Desulfallas sp. Bu1-1]MBF7083976.1 complex I NDUFA9 subunit family protein [Desulfallas sp. Bu1-1]
MILVTGGTGLVGKHLVRALMEKGYQVRCLVRSQQKAGELLPPGVELVRGEINDLAAVKKACKGVKKIIHLVAIIREHGENTFEHINVEGTLNLVIAAGQAGVERFIHMSALGACNNPRYKYAYSKWRGEEAVVQSGLNWTILRPSIIYGHGFNFFDRMLQSLRMCPRPFVPIPGKGSTLFQPIAVEDVVRCLCMICENSATVGQIIEIGGPEHLSYVQMLDRLLEHLGEKRYKLHIPMPLMRLVVPLMGSIMRDPPVSPVELKQLEINNITDIESVEKHFGFIPVALHDGLK